MCSGEFPSAQAVPEDALSGPYPNMDLCMKPLLCVGQECGLG